MAKLVFGMNQSLDGYVDHTAFGPSPTLFRHFIEEARGQAGSLYGRRMYEIMRYWDDDQPEWGEAERAFAAAWRKQPKWVVSRSLKSVGPNATLIATDPERVVRELKAGRQGEIEVAGPQLANSLTSLGLIDEYRIYLHPVVLGKGRPYFAGPRPPLRLTSHERIDEDVLRLTYVPAWMAPGNRGKHVTVKRMDNVGIVVEDLDVAIGFFTELGLTFEGRMVIEGDWSGRVTGLRGQRVEIAMMRTPDGHSRLELSRFDAPAIASDHRTAPVNSLGYLRVMFTVEDIDDTLVRLASLGATVVDEVVNYEDTYRLCYIRGPEGILIGLAEEIGQPR